MDSRPDSAGNDARKIMDFELAIAAQGLQIRLPYVRGDGNDKRTAHDFLNRLAADGKKCFQKKVGQDFIYNTDALDLFVKADRLLTSWGNRASHTFDLIMPKAISLIDSCEKAVEAFKCESCSKNVWFTDASKAEWVQCQCGNLRWRYGKG